jgi:glycosyltransferase involved in cell wall biosynthesis
MTTGMFLRQYNENNYDVDFLSFVPWQDYQRIIDNAELNKLCRSVTLIPIKYFFSQDVLYNYYLALKSVYSSHSFMYNKYFSSSLNTEIIKKVKTNKYDLIHNEIITAFSQFKKNNTPKVFIQHNIDYLHFQHKQINSKNLLSKMFYSIQVRKLKKEEKYNADIANLIFTVGDEDIESLRKLDVATDKLFNFTYPIKIDDNKQTISKKNSIISLGNLSAPKRKEGTLWFARKVFPLIKQEIKDIEWHIIGKYPPGEIAELNDNTNIFVHGFVDDISSIISTAKVCVAPIFEGTGKLMKIDYMTENLIPCVTTEYGSINTKLEKDKTIFVTNDQNKFASFVINILGNDTVYSKIRENIKKHVLNYNNNNNIQLLENKLCIK